MKKIFTLFIVLFYTISCVLAVDFDTSIDDTIRKNYNLTTDDSELPALPNVVPTDTPEYSNPEPVKTKATGKTYIIKAGTKIKLSSKSVISDRLHEGSKLTFYSVNGFFAEDKTIIPAGTMFKGRIINSHAPQLTGNGGLIVFMIDEIYFNGVKSQIDAKVSKANSKKIFFNNIKGKRMYWKNTSKATTPGRKAFSATQSAASAMSAVPILNIISFVPLVGGAVVYTVNLVCAPIVAVFTKGGSISLPPGTSFEIKVMDDTQIKG